jgi:hypothetical protein
MQILDEMVQPPHSSSPKHPNRPTKRLSSDESLWEGTPGREPAVVASPTLSPPEAVLRRSLWRRMMRVNLLLAGAAVMVLLVGFGLGAAVGGRGRPAPASAPPVAVAASVTSIVVRPGPPPSSCRTAVEAADRAIAYLTGKIRDDRLTRALQQYVESKRACQRAVR